MKAYTKVDERLFNAVKTLLAGGATYNECADYMNIGTTAVGRISSAENFTEYKSMLAAIALSAREKTQAAKKAEQKKAYQKAEPEKKPEPEAVKDSKPVAVPEKIVEHRYDVTVQTTHYMSQKLDKIEELLKGISQKMGYICEDLYGNKKEGE